MWKYPTSSGNSLWDSTSDVVQTAVTVEIAPLHVRVGGSLQTIILWECLLLSPSASTTSIYQADFTTNHVSHVSFVKISMPKI